KLWASESWLWPISFVVFLWTTLEGFVLVSATPDIFVAFFVFLIAALVLRFIRLGLEVHDVALFAGVLGLGYLTKTVLLPIGLVAAAALAFALRRERLFFRRALAAAALFTAIALVYAGAISYKYGRFTYGESGRFNFLWQVNGVPVAYATGAGTGEGALINDYRKPEHGALFVFDRRPIGTWPYWYDPGYWLEGLRPKFDGPAFVSLLKENGRLLANYFWGELLALSAVAGILLFLAVAFRRAWAVGEVTQALWPAVAISFAGFAGYAALRIDHRYLGPFASIIYVWAFFALAPSAFAKFARLALVFCAGMFLVQSTYTITRIHELGGAQFGFGAQDKFASRHLRLEIAEDLQRLGLRPGDRIAAFTSAERWQTPAFFWAKLAGVQIIADFKPASGDPFDEFEKLSEAARGSLLAELRRAGAIAIVAALTDEQRARATLEWKKAARSGHSVHFLSPPAHE
ncbi:MAG TPA: hypothetical protein VFV50_10390, partial [Bdellovibrionales bacterium]|nr:hypothetical protein [Bdellovibrionales bacterium]